MRADGSVEVALDVAALEPLAARIEATGAGAVAVSLLNACLEDRHERALAEWLPGRFPDLPVSLSSDISPEIREFERTSTTVLNALLLPVVGGYLDRLSARLNEAGIAVSHRLATTIFAALYEAIPGRVPAACYGVSYVCSFQTLGEKGERRVLVEIEVGGTCACHDQDGVSAWSFGMHSNASIPVEMIEADVPLTVMSCGLIPGSGARGATVAGLVCSGNGVSTVMLRSSPTISSVSNAGPMALMAAAKGICG